MYYISDPIAPGELFQHFEKAMQSCQAPPCRTYLAIDENTGSSTIGIMAINWGDNESDLSEIGIMLVPEIHNKGYATEALNSLISYIFTQTTTAGIYMRHKRSHETMSKLAQKLGFLYAEKPNIAGDDCSIRYCRLIRK